LHRERLAQYYLPEAQGGHLSLILQIVQETIDRWRPAASRRNQARSYLGNAITDINAGRFKRAFN